MSALGSVEGTYAGSCCVGVVTPVVFGLDDAAAAVLPGADVIIALAPDPCVVLVLGVLEVPPDMLLNVWLMEIS